MGSDCTGVHLWKHVMIWIRVESVKGLKINTTEMNTSITRKLLTIMRRAYTNSLKWRYWNIGRVSVLDYIKYIYCVGCCALLIQQNNWLISHRFKFWHFTQLYLVKCRLYFLKIQNENLIQKFTCIRLN